MAVTKQSKHLYAIEALTARGRKETLTHYRNLRKLGVPQVYARNAYYELAHGVWMAKNGGW